MQNPILAALKLIVFTAFTIFLALTFFQNHSNEVKFIKTREKVDALVTQVSELGRQVDKVAEQAEKTREASERTRDHVDTLVELAGKGLIGGGTNGSGPTRSERASTKKRTVQRREDRTSKPSRIGTQAVYPYNPGWLVLCDKSANQDPKRDIPADQVDWSATLHDYTAGEPKGLNPFNTDRTSTVVALSVYVLDVLAGRKTSNYEQYNAKLAERVEESPDHRRYMIYMRKGVRWHDPEPKMLAEHPWLKQEKYVTAHDVKFTIDLLSNPNTSTPHAYLFDDLEDVIVHDDYTVEIVWKRANFYARATSLDIQPIPEHIWAYDPNGDRYPDADIPPQFGKHWFGKSMCGSGPIRFVEYKRSEYIRCERNENYYGDRFPCKEYYYHIIPDNESRIARFWNGELPFVILPPEDYRRFVLEGVEAQPIPRFEPFLKPAPAAWKFVHFLWRRPTYSGFGWNMRKPYLADKRVRRALTLALNRSAVVDSIFYGLGEVIAIGDSVFSPYFHDGIKPLPFDLEAARKLLTEAGWVDSNGDGIREKTINGTETNLEFELLISASSPDQKTMVQMYKEDLLKCGVKLEPNPAESALWSKKIHERSFDGFIIFWTAGMDSDPRQIWESKRADDPGSNNYTGFRNPQADQIFQDLITEFDLEQRKALFRKWYEIEFDEQPYTWIWSIKSPIGCNADWRMPEPQLPTPKLDRRLMFKWKKRS